MRHSECIRKFSFFGILFLRFFFCMTPVLLLAAGKSTRTWPLSEKIFLEICGKTILEHQIQSLLDANFYDICVVGNTENIKRIQMICHSLEGNFSFAIQEDLETGIRGGILSAEKNISKEKPLLIMCSNDVVEKSAFETIQSTAKKSDSKIFLLGKKVEKYFPGGYLEVFQKENIQNRLFLKKIVEKPGEGNEPSDLVTLLIHFFREPEILLSALKNYQTGDYYEEALQHLFNQEISAEAVEYTGFWQAIKYPWHFLEVTKFFLNHISQSYIHPGASIAKTAVLGDRVVIEKNARILDGAIIAGPAYIGEDTIVANHALVRESVIERNCVVGYGTEIARSLLQKYCWTHQNFVGDSVFDENTSLGAGTRTGNLRLEEGEIFSEIRGQKISSQRQKLGCILGKNIRVGVNTSFMPGIKIGANTFIGAGMVLSQDIPENRFVKEKREFLERENNFSAPKRDVF